MFASFFRHFTLIVCIISFYSHESLCSCDGESETDLDVYYNILLLLCTKNCAITFYLLNYLTLITRRDIFSYYILFIEEKNRGAERYML